MRGDFESGPSFHWRRAVADILVVVDHPLLGIDLWDMLQNEGHEVRHVTSGQAALAAVARRMPDLIVTDHTMPGENGGTFVQALRSDPRWAEIPLIQVGRAAVSGRADAASASFIRKPWSQVALLNQVSRLTALPGDSDLCQAG
jgi:CheY-like chemotaxis protein